MKTIKYDEIKTPETVQEFRTNLKKFFCCTGNNRNELYLQEDPHYLDVNSLKSVSDLYDLKYKNTRTPRIVPMIDFDTSSLTADESSQGVLGRRDFSNVFKDENRCKIYEINNDSEHDEYIQSHKPNWYAIDNQILRSFYIKTLGDFSGYVRSKVSESA